MLINSDRSTETRWAEESCQRQHQTIDSQDVETRGVEILKGLDATSYLAVSAIVA